MKYKAAQAVGGFCHGAFARGCHKGAKGQGMKTPKQGRVDLATLGFSRSVLPRINLAKIVAWVIRRLKSFICGLIHVACLGHCDL